MPPRGYKTITISDDVYRRLEEFRNNMRLSSISDAIRVLLEYGDMCVGLKQLIEQGPGNSRQVMDKLNAIERMLDLIHVNIVELYNACTRRGKPTSGQQTLEETVKKSDTSDVYKPSDVWKGFKEEAIKLFEEIFNEYVVSKRKRGGRS